MPCSISHLCSPLESMFVSSSRSSVLAAAVDLDFKLQMSKSLFTQFIMEAYDTMARENDQPKFSQTFQRIINMDDNDSIGFKSFSGSHTTPASSIEGSQKPAILIKVGHDKKSLKKKIAEWHQCPSTRLAIGLFIDLKHPPSHKDKWFLLKIPKMRLFLSMKNPCKGSKKSNKADLNSGNWKATLKSYDLSKYLGKLPLVHIPMTFFLPPFLQSLSRGQSRNVPKQDTVKTAVLNLHMLCTRFERLRSHLPNGSF